MLLLRAWQAPWSPTTHASFQPDFRNAAKAVALCTHKLGFPHEIVSGICSFLNRDWWDDSRKQCWSYDCRSEMNFKILSPKKSEQCTSDTKTEALEYCPNCRVALYCSKNCREKDYKETHKKRCCRPPFRTTLPDYEELQLCVEILQTGDTSLPQFLTARSTAAIDNVRQASMFPSSTNQSIGDENVDDDSDAGSWETVGSDEGADDTEMSPITKTTRIYKYFKETAYKPKI